MATTATVTISSDIYYTVVEEVDQFNVNRYSNSQADAFKISRELID